MSKFIGCYNKTQQPLNENRDPYSLQCGVHNVQQKNDKICKEVRKYDSEEKNDINDEISSQCL